MNPRGCLVLFGVVLVAMPIAALGQTQMVETCVGGKMQRYVDGKPVPGGNPAECATHGASLDLIKVSIDVPKANHSDSDNPPCGDPNAHDKVRGLVESLARAFGSTKDEAERVSGLSDKVVAACKSSGGGLASACRSLLNIPDKSSCGIVAITVNVPMENFNIALFRANNNTANNDERCFDMRMPSSTQPWGADKWRLLEAGTDRPYGEQTGGGCAISFSRWDTITLRPDPKVADPKKAPFVLGAIFKNWSDKTQTGNLYLWYKPVK